MIWKEEFPWFINTFPLHSLPPQSCQNMHWLTGWPMQSVNKGQDIFCVRCYLACIGSQSPLWPYWLQVLITSWTGPLLTKGAKQRCHQEKEFLKRTNSSWNAGSITFLDLTPSRVCWRKRLDPVNSFSIHILKQEKLLIQYSPSSTKSTKFLKEEKP